MKFAIVGAGAIGAYVGACLAAGGEEVALVARGPHLEAMQKQGVRVRLETGQTLTAHPYATDNPAEIGAVDVVFLTVKAQSLRAVSPSLAPLLGPETPVVAGQNGVPWWFFENWGGPLKDTHLKAVDPDGFLSATIPAQRVIGCVVYCSAVMVAPGVIEQTEGNRFAIGELHGARSERCRRIAHAFQKGGLKCVVRSRIRHDVWVKLIGNMAFNPISALTRANLEEILRDPDASALARAIMEEGHAVAHALGLELDISVDQRFNGAARVGPHKTSSLQDIEMGRSLETEAIAGAVVELADRLGVRIPQTKAVYTCARLLERQNLRHSDSRNS